MLRVFVITNDYYLWCLSPFAYLFNKYWSPAQEVVVAGFRSPKEAMPPNFRFHTLGRVNAPQNQWSNGLIKFLEEMPDEFSIIMLEDYWIYRPVDSKGIEILAQQMRHDPHILRMDLTGDVAYCRGDPRYAYNFGFINHYDIVKKPPGVSYRMSFQAGIWNNRLLLSLLKKDKDPWQVEIYTPVPDDILVLGTKQWPLRYANAIWKGELDTREIQLLHADDYKIIEKVIPPTVTRRKYE